MQKTLNRVDTKSPEVFNVLVYLQLLDFSAVVNQMKKENGSALCGEKPKNPESQARKQDL